MAPLPQARVVSKRGTAPAPPPVPWRERVAAFEDGLGPRARGALAAFIGLWPITAVVLLMLGLTWLSAMQGSP
jgi:hypothetical protein